MWRISCSLCMLVYSTTLWSVMRVRIGITVVGSLAIQMWHRTVCLPKRVFVERSSCNGVLSPMSIWLNTSQIVFSSKTLILLMIAFLTLCRDHFRGRFLVCLLLRRHCVSVMLELRFQTRFSGRLFF